MSKKRVWRTPIPRPGGPMTDRKKAASKKAARKKVRDWEETA